MMFKVGNKVQIILKEQRFYGGMYNLTLFTGIILNVRGNCIYVKFDNAPTTSLAIINEDLEPVKIKGQQLEFKFMEEVKNAI